MTSVLKQTFVNVKKFLFPTRENEDPRRTEPGGLTVTGLQFKQFNRVGTKRFQDHFEAELTEDDDDYSPPAASSKRLKTDDDISIVYYSKDSPSTKIAMPFGSQPSHDPPGLPPKCPNDPGGLKNVDKKYKSEVRTFKGIGPEGAKEGTSSTFAKSLGSQIPFRLDIDTKKSGNSSGLPFESTATKPWSLSSILPTHKKDATAFKKSHHDKKQTKAKISWFNRLGFKTELSNTVRMEEKQRYIQLLEKMSKPLHSGLSRDGGWGIRDQVQLVKMGQIQIRNQTSMTLSRGTHLQLSRMEKPLIETICDRSSPTVMFRRADMLTPNFIAGKYPTTSTTFLPASGIRLFSVPQPQIHGAPTVTPRTPTVIDLEAENAENVAPSSRKAKDYLGGTPEFSSTPTARRRLIPSFEDLNDAEAASDLLLQESFADDVLINATPKEKNISQVDDDLVILSESIVRKGRERRVNSLALEQTSSPYPQKSWLSDLSTDWRESNEQRKRKIEIEKETLNILRNESKIEQTLQDALRKKLTLTEIIELEEKPLTLPDLTDEMRSVINSAVRPGRDSDILGTVFNVDITRGDVKTLAPCKWLNDNVINVYMELIADRSKSGKYPKCHVFTTFFYPKYLKEGYSNALKRWTRKVDIFAHELLIFPIHLGMHWCLAVADLRKKELKYYDSLGGRNDKCLRALLEYMSHEMKERKSQVLETSEWTLENVKGIPEQENGSDCGMFTCKFAECLAREGKIDFIKQQNMNYYRERMIYELLKKDLMFP